MDPYNQYDTQVFLMKYDQNVQDTLYLARKVYIFLKAVIDMVKIYIVQKTNRESEHREKC